MILKVMAAPMRTHDMSQVLSVHPALQPTDILVADRGFCSYVHLALLLQRGVHGVFRVHQRQIVDFTPHRPFVMPTEGKNDRKKGKPRSRWIKRLGKLDQVVEWFKPSDVPDWMEESQFNDLPESLQLRELRYRVCRTVFRVRSITLVTTLLEDETYTLGALSELYFARWRIETNFAHLKTTMGLDVLKCKTVDGVLKEMIIFALINNLVRLVMLAAAQRQKVEVERISFIDAVRWLATADEAEKLCYLVVNPARPFRYEPRVRKRRPKQYQLMSATRKQLRNSLKNNRKHD